MGAGGVGGLGCYWWFFSAGQYFDIDITNFGEKWCHYRHIYDFILQVNTMDTNSHDIASFASSVHNYG